MKLLTVQAKLVCKHVTGVVVNLIAGQNMVYIGDEPVLVDNDPEGRIILGCANVSLTIKPCTQTLRVHEGYSELIHINGQRACLDTVTGLTDGTPPGVVRYVVADPAQDFVEGAA